MTDDITNDTYVNPDRDAALGAQIDRAADELHQGVTTPAGTVVGPATALNVTPAESVPVTDRTTVRIVVCAIALIVLLVVVASCLLPLVDRAVPSDAWDIAKMLGGALIGVLASTRSVKS